MIKKNANEQKKLNPIDTIEVMKVTYVSPDPEKTRILFNGCLNGSVVVNTMSYVEIVKDGKEMHFVSMPSEKGRDGKYYNTVRCFIPDDVVENVRVQIEKILEE